MLCVQVNLQVNLTCPALWSISEKHSATLSNGFQKLSMQAEQRRCQSHVVFHLLGTACSCQCTPGWPWLTKIIQDPKGRRLLTKDIVYGLTKISQPIWRHAQRSSKIHGVSTRGKFIPSPTPSFNKRIFQLTAAILEGCGGWSPLRFSQQRITVHKLNWP